MPLLSKNLLKKLEPRKSVYDVRDTSVRGFMVRIAPSGNMSFAVQYARGKRYNLGNISKFDSVEEARKRAQRILSDYGMDQVDPTETEKRRKGKEITFKQFLQKEFQPHALVHHKGRPHETIKTIEKHFQAFFTKRLGDITTEHILKWRRDVLSQGAIKKNTVNKILGSLRLLFKLAVQFNYIDRHPCDGIKPLKCPDERVRYLSEDEHEKLMSALTSRDERLKRERESANEHRRQRGYDLYPATPYFGDHLKPAVLVSLHSGLRKTELFSLERNDLDFYTKNISVKDSKSGKRRNVPMNEVVYDTLQKWLEQTSDLNSAYVFPSPLRHDTHIKDVKDAWNTLLGRSKDPKRREKDMILIDDFHWHDLRHDFASKLVMAGVDLNTVRELLGHADIKMTLRYAHLAPHHLQNSVAKLVNQHVA